MHITLIIGVILTAAINSLSAVQCMLLCNWYGSGCGMCYHLPCVLVYILTPAIYSNEGLLYGHNTVWYVILWKVIL